MKAFTLIEIIVVIAILGILGVFAIPRLAMQNEAAVISEGVNVLTTYRGAQMRYSLDHNAFTATCSDLDISITPKNFNNIACSAPALTGGDAVLVTVDRLNGPYAYTVRVSRDGVFSCPSCGNDLLRRLPK